MERLQPSKPLKADTVWGLVERRAEATPDGFMLVDERDRTLTFAGYRDACERAAAGLAVRGVGENTPVCWQLPTWIETFILYGALARLGAIQSPIIPIYREREVRLCLRQTGARLFVVPPIWNGFDYPAFAQAIAADVGDCDVLICDRELPVADPATLPPPPTPQGDPTRFVFYTSGTTAEPKGARHTDASAIAGGFGLSAAIDNGPGDRYGITFPVAHSGGLTNLVSMLQLGYGAIFVERFDPPRTVEVMRRHGATVVGGGTVFFQAYLAEQRKQPDTPIFPKLRWMPGGGAPMPPEIYQQVKDEMFGVTCVMGYGMTECPMITMGSIDDPPEKLMNTEGRPIPGLEIRAVTSEGVAAALGVEGEICVRGAAVCRGYLDASLDAKAFDEDGFFRTGDMGTLDADDFVVLTGRIKDIIIRKGENISANEIEDLLYEHPKVMDAAVVALPDPERGERACAVVTCTDLRNPLTLDELVSWFQNADLMPQKIPEQLEILTEMPRNTTGKILKYQLRDRFKHTSIR